MKKEFDCVEMKRKAQEKIYEEIKDMTLEEELSYWQKSGEALKEKIAKAKKKHAVLN